MFGRRLNEFREYKDVKLSKSLDIAVWKSRQQTLVNEVYPAVNERVTKAKNADEYDSKLRIIDENAFPVGSNVMMVDKTRASKWDPVYEGPFIVFRRNRGGAYVLKDSVGEL